jgi:hypothetical protein
MSDETTRQRKFKIGRLTDLDGVTRELARVYRHARRGEIDSSKAYRLATILGTMAKTMETSELEKRLDEIEQALLARGRIFHPKIVS